MRIILSAVFLMASLFSKGQECVRSGAIVQTDVMISGTASLIHRGDSLVVKLSSDFISDSGPDLDVYLSNEPNPVATGVRLDALQSLSGEQFYDVPNQVNISDYSYIVIHCTQYNHLYGSASLGSATGECGVALSNIELELDQVKIFARNHLIKVKSGGVELSGFTTEIYNQTGQVLHTSNSATTAFEVDSSGVYFVKIYKEDITRTEKLLVK